MDSTDIDSTIAAGNVIRPKPSRAETKADITDHAARAIITAEAESREAKTAKLRQARLERQAAQPAAAAPSRAKATKNRKG